MSVGAQLRAAREARGLSLDGLAQAIRVQPRILAAIERDDITSVPPRPFGRGFVGSYARELGLDADRLARDYFAQFAPTADAHPEPDPAPTLAFGRSLPGGIVAALCILAVLAIGVVITLGRLGGTSTVADSGPRGTSDAAAAARRPTDDATPAAAALATSSSPSTAPDTAVPATAPATPPGSTTAAPATPSAPLTIALTATRPSWVSATADGTRVVYQIVRPDTPQTISAERVIILRVGDAGALQWQINNRDAVPMGRSGQVRELRITPGNAATIQ